MSITLDMCKKYLGKEVYVLIDRPLGSKHPNHDLIYETNYGYIPNTKAPDGEQLDAYYLGVNEPLKKVKGYCIAIIHRLNDDDDKLVVVPNKMNFSDKEISEAVYFQEKWFKSEIIRK